MAVKLQWRDNSTADAGHIVYRKPAGSGNFTAIADLTGRLPSETGVIYWTDTDTLTPGDYTYKIDNYTQSGVTGSSDETTISVFDPESVVLCLSLDDNFADGAQRHLISNFNAAIAPLSGAYFNNAYLQSDTYITFPEKFSLSFAIYPEGVNSTNSTLLICRDSNNIDWHVYLKPNGKIKWTSHGHDTHGGGASMESVNATVNYNEWNYIHITGDTSINKRHIYINGEKGYCCSTWTNSNVMPLPQPAPSPGTILSVGQDPVIGTTTSFKGYISDVAFIAGQVTVPSTCHLCPMAPPPLTPPGNVQVTIIDYPTEQSILRGAYEVSANIAQDTADGLLRAPDEVGVQIVY